MMFIVTIWAPPRPNFMNMLHKLVSFWSALTLLPNFQFSGGSYSAHHLSVWRIQKFDEYTYITNDVYVHVYE